VSKGLECSRTNMCGELKETHIGRDVVLTGWVHRRRDHGGLIFIDLRDRTGLVQIVFNPETDLEAFQKAETVRSEYVLAVKGRVSARPEGTVNENLPTGRVEVYVSELEIVTAAKTPPFTVFDADKVDESVRLKYRYLDLRRPDLQEVLYLRHKTTMEIRKFLDRAGFWEIETPMLTKNTPEGAREYVVPSRIHTGEFYVLPQSPQLLKQILMVSGIDKYFQIVRCFRDEDLRADRQPEFTQLDMEMSFVDEGQVMSLIEGLMSHLFYELLDIPLKTPLKRMTYAEAMERFGTDRPDTRFGMELVDISDIAEKTDFKVFTGALSKGGQVKGINAKGCGGYSRKEIDELIGFVGNFGAKGLAWMIVTEEGVKSPIGKFFSQEQMSEIIKIMGAEPGDLLLFVAGKPKVTADSLGNLRLELARRLNLINGGQFNFVWVTDFPLVNYNEEEKRWEANHHPFTSPKEEDLEFLETDPGSVRAKAYDLVLNGIEIGGGSIRIHRRNIQEKVFKVLGYSPEEYYSKFGFLLEAFEYGTPPHGGIAFGLDRMVMLMAGKDSIRDCIAFPKTQSATCLMTDAPSKIPEQQLRELGIRTVKKKAGK
jgi:aspartyl-tRNA synthetase